MKKRLVEGFMAAALGMLLVSGCGSTAQPGEETAASMEETEGSAVLEKEETKDASETEEATETGAEEDIDADTENMSDKGVVIDASMNAATIQMANGFIVEYSLAEDWDSSGLSKGLVLGEGVQITLDKEDENLITAMKTLKTPADTGALAVAGEVILAVQDQELEYLTGLCAYPVMVDGKEVGSQQDFMKAYKDEDNFSEDFVKSVTGTTLYLVPVSKDHRIFLGSEEGAPGITLGKTESGWKVTEINWK